MSSYWPERLKLILTLLIARSTICLTERKSSKNDVKKTWKPNSAIFQRVWLKGPKRTSYGASAPKFTMKIPAMSVSTPHPLPFLIPNLLPCSLFRKGETAYDPPVDKLPRSAAVKRHLGGLVAQVGLQLGELRHRGFWLFESASLQHGQEARAGGQGSSVR
jgi:hypothetical protein